VHILSTFETTGAGGTKQTLFFLGQKEFQGQVDTLFFSVTSDATDQEIRAKQLDYLKLGLIRYIAKTPMVNKISISFSDEDEQDAIMDKWNS
jgi:hypothetical protein